MNPSQCLPSPPTAAAVFVIDPQQQAADLAARPGTGSESTDHEFLAELALQFQPGFGAATGVPGRQTFRDDALQAHLARGLEDAGPVGVEGLAQPHAPVNVICKQPLQDRSTITEHELPVGQSKYSAPMIAALGVPHEIVTHPACPRGITHQYLAGSWSRLMANIETSSGRNDS